MRASAHGYSFLILGVFIACSGESEPGGGGTGAKGGSPSAGSSGSSGVSGSSGARSSAGAGAVSGAAGASGGGAGTSGGGGYGGSNGGGTAGAGNSGGTSAGRAAGDSGTSGGGATSEGGMSGEAGAPAMGGAPSEPDGLSWPVDCVPGESCARLGYPDTDQDGTAHDCSAPGYVGHQGTDIDTSAGTPVRAAADGVVLFVFDGKFDECPNAGEPDCQDPPSVSPGSTVGNTVCTPSGPYCGTGTGDCFWCFAGGNVIVIRHDGVPGVFATRYDHLKRGSTLVMPGDTVTRGEKIAEVGSSGSSTSPHLHFEVWGTGFYELADPWAGPCGPNLGPSLWAYDPPWSE